jgi:acyl-CoA reductase-like NAD-dependent aldehyde dehydrogenase
MATTQGVSSGNGGGQPREELSSIDPRSGEIVGKVPVHSAADVNDAVARAREASVQWAALPLEDRVGELVRFRKALAAASDELAELIHRENGKSRLEALTEVFMALGHVDHAAKRAEPALAPRRVPAGLLANYRATVSYHPLGVIAVIGPWNYPMFTPMGSIAYALAAGNAVVFKPSELTPLIAVRIAEIAAQSIAVPNLVQVVTGAGPTGAALVRAAVDKIAFTGSTATGKKIMAAAAERLTPVLLELGGKDAMIVADDADLDKAAEACVFGALTNTGQACISVERVYVAESVHDAFVDKVVAQVKQLRVGGDDGHLGAMTSPAQVAIVKDHIQDAVARGASVRTGGADAIAGNYIQPTVLTDVTHDMKVMTEETFGPVIPIARVESTEDAVRLANDSKYGLGSTVFGKRGREIADRIRAGMTSVNSVMGFAGIPALPFGGVGESGFGRIHGDDGIREFSRIKSTAEETVSLPMSFMTFRLPASMNDRLRTMIRQLYGDGAVAKAQDAVRKIRNLF